MNHRILSLILAAGLALPAWSAERAPQRPVNLNTATVTELMQLPRIGAKTAERIVAFRKQHGAFQRPEDLLNVRGIGEKSFARLRSHLSVGTAARPASGKPAGRGSEE